MQNSDRKDFAALLGDVHGFYSTPISPFALSVWWQACQPFALDAVRKALTAHAMDPERGAFCPKPADVVRQLRGTSRDDSLIGWQNVLGQARSVGRYGTPKLTPAESQALGAIGGWQRLCNSDEAELGFLQKQFCDNFSAYVQSEDRALMNPEVQRLAGDAIKRIAQGATDE